MTGCGCATCSATHVGSTSGPLANAPGLSALTYRVGTHDSFSRAMKLALAAPTPLRALTTREVSDPTIALMDAWAAVLDVLTFYQERIANEGYLRTARERRSILELARSIGYELRPGVAASTPLAFLLDDTDASPQRATIPVGTKVQSVPRQNEQSQIFETVEEIEGRRIWNAMRPLRRIPRPPASGDDTLYLRGIGLKLQVGDGMLVVNDEKLGSAESTLWDFRRIQLVEERPDAFDARRGDTVVTLDGPLEHIVQPGPGGKPIRVYTFRRRARLYGHNAMRWDTLPVALRVVERDAEDEVHRGPFDKKELEWVNAVFDDVAHVDLDAVYHGLVASSATVRGRWVVLTNPAATQAFRITGVSEIGQDRYLLTGVTTRLTIEGQGISSFSARNAFAFIESEELELTRTPVVEPVSGSAIVVEGRIDTLPPGRAIALIDDRADMADAPNAPVAPAPRRAEIGVVKRMVATDVPIPPLAPVEGSGGTAPTSEWRTTITLEDDLGHEYQATTLMINGNVARATHGETRTGEVLGSGDASRAFQRFSLKGKPLTFTTGLTARGARSTLEIRVNGLLWTETRSFFGCGPSDHVYRLQVADDGTSTVTFGDGLRGARPSSGPENIEARRYRVGSGLAGLVEVGQLSLILNRPLGVKTVTNPLPAAGGDDAERTDMARRNAPLTILTLDRIVSLRDLEDYASAFAGIAKARATFLWTGQRRLLHLTIAGANGTAIPPGSDIATSLRAALDGARHPAQPIRIDSYRLDETSENARTFDLRARLFIDPRALPDDVIAAAREALLTAFSFDRRQLGESVRSSDVISVIQRTPHVLGVDLDALHFTENAVEGEPATVEPTLPARPARVVAGTIHPAQLVTINPAGILLTAVTR